MKNSFLLVAFTIFSFCSFSQTTLPYHSGFDNFAQCSGWLEFRTGYPGTSNWGYTTFNPYSTPDCLNHDYPVSSSGTDTTIDWFVSPGFNFTSGGKIDSLKIKVYSIMGSSWPVDEISLYLLSGSNNPTMATSVVLLAELKGMVSNQDIWRDTGNFTIPATSGTSYIGIKYRATNNWFVINMDNLYFSAKTSGIDEPNVSNAKMILYPNPVIDYLNISFSGIQDGVVDLSITNSFGQKVLAQQIKSNTQHTSIDVSKLTAGSYIVRAISGTKMIYNHNLIIIK